MLKMNPIFRDDETFQFMNKSLKKTDSLYTPLIRFIQSFTYIVFMKSRELYPKERGGRRE